MGCRRGHGPGPGPAPAGCWAHLANIRRGQARWGLTGLGPFPRAHDSRLDVQPWPVQGPQPGQEPLNTPVHEQGRRSRGISVHSHTGKIAPNHDCHFGLFIGSSDAQMMPAGAGDRGCVGGFVVKHLITRPLGDGHMRCRCHCQFRRRHPFVPWGSKRLPGFVQSQSTVVSAETTSDVAMGRT
jgi:hypothetical protein